MLNVYDYVLKKLMIFLYHEYGTVNQALKTMLKKYLKNVDQASEQC